MIKNDHTIDHKMTNISIVFNLITFFFIRVFLNIRLKITLQNRNVPLD